MSRIGGILLTQVSLPELPHVGAGCYSLKRGPVGSQGWLDELACGVLCDDVALRGLVGRRRTEVVAEAA